jgi:hypothetical protein
MISFLIFTEAKAFGFLGLHILDPFPRCHCPTHLLQYVREGEEGGWEKRSASVLLEK